jgi:hypothetical protein
VFGRRVDQIPRGCHGGCQRDAALGVLDELVRRMFDSADDVLFEMGEKSSSDDERRRYFDRCG